MMWLRDKANAENTNQMAFDHQENLRAEHEAAWKDMWKSGVKISEFFF